MFSNRLLKKSFVPETSLNRSVNKPESDREPRSVFQQPANLCWTIAISSGEHKPRCSELKGRRSGSSSDETTKYLSRKRQPSSRVIRGPMVNFRLRFCADYCAMWQITGASWAISILTAWDFLVNNGRYLRPFTEIVRQMGLM
jgi:hypothetical protein